MRKYYSLYMCGQLCEEIWVRSHKLQMYLRFTLLALLNSCLIFVKKWNWTDSSKFQRKLSEFWNHHLTVLSTEKRLPTVPSFRIFTLPILRSFLLSSFDLKELNSFFIFYVLVFRPPVRQMVASGITFVIKEYYGMEGEKIKQERDIKKKTKGRNGEW